MGKYPVDISEEVNSKMKYPFLPTDKYEDFIHTPEGTTILIRKSTQKLSKEMIDDMVRINQRIALRGISGKAPGCPPCL